MDSEVKVWVRWEELAVLNDRKRWEVHYYVRDDGGVRDLAVVGREKSARYMAYSIPAKFLQSLHRMSTTALPSATPEDRRQLALIALRWLLEMRETIYCAFTSRGECPLLHDDDSIGDEVVDEPPPDPSQKTLFFGSDANTFSDPKATCCTGKFLRR